jgi:phosphate-selective porin OprO/OprP
MRTSNPIRGAALLALAAAAGVTAANAAPAPPAPPPPPPPTFSAAPQFRDGAGDFTFKVRGRLMWDIYSVDANFPLTANDQNYRRTGLRRARLGVEGQFTPKFRYQAEATFSGGQANWEDMRLEYVGKDYSVFIGNTNTFEPMEELTSSRFMNFNERGKFTEAFGFGRFAGVGVVTSGPNWSWRAALQGDGINNAETANQDELYQIKSRLTFAPLLVRSPEGDHILHLGANVRYRDRGDGAAFGYQARPQADGFGTRFISAGAIGAEDTMISAEAAYMRGPLKLASEFARLDVTRVTGPDVTFRGGYLDAVWNITGEGHAYNGRTGAFGRVAPLKPIHQGGPGAWQVGVRYDYLDLTDGNVVGGEQNSVVLGLNWFPIDFVGFKLNYAYNNIDRGLPGVTNQTASGEANVISLRTQFDF